MSTISGRQFLQTESYIYKDEYNESENADLMFCSIKTDIKEVKNFTHNGYLINRMYTNEKTDLKFKLEGHANETKLSALLDPEKLRRIYLHF